MIKYISTLTTLLLVSHFYIYAQYNGIDVSHHQGNIKWEDVATDQKIQYVYIKATTGSSGTDSCYRKNIDGAKKYGLKVGSYHYFTSKSSATTQAKHFIEVARLEEQDLRPMVDVENMNGWTQKQIQDSLSVFIAIVKEHYGKAPIIYGTNRSYNTHCAPKFNNYHLMIGRYGANQPIIKGTGHYSIWQYSETGKIKGIPKPVDLSKFHPDYSIKDFLLNP